MRERTGFIFILLSVLFQALSGVLSKYASMMADGISAVIILNAFFVLSLLCLFAQAIVWQQALKRYPLSYAYPFLSLVNFTVLILSYVFFNEVITIMNIVGLVVISGGIYVLSADGGVA